MLTLDKELFLLINGLNAEWADTIMSHVSYKLTWVPLYVILLVPLYKQMGMKLFGALLAVGFLIVVADQTSVHLFKDVFKRLRPCHEPELQGLVHLVNNKCGGQFGFLSSHATNTFALATFLSLLMRGSYRWLPVILFVWALLNMYSRVYLGVHYPGDVLAGAIYGSGLGFLVFRGYVYFQQKLGSSG